MPPQRFDQALFPEFLSAIVERFSDAVGVEGEDISSEQQPFLDRAIPFLEKPHNRGRGIEPFNAVILPEEKGGEMPATHVAQPAQLIMSPKGCAR